MAKPRTRYDDNDRPCPCDVRLTPELAVYLYRETIERGYLDESELLRHIVRTWAESLDPVDWKKLLKQLKERDAEGKKKPGSKTG